RSPSARARSAIVPRPRACRRRAAAGPIDAGEENRAAADRLRRTRLSVRSSPPDPALAAAARRRGRSMLVKKTEPLPIECVARGYLSGSGWKDYQATGAVCGVQLPAGLRESDRLPHALFTPATKA